MSTRSSSLPHVMVFCVNYHSYDYLRTFMQSVEQAAAVAQGLCSVTLCVGDNTTDHWEEIPTSLTPHCTLRTFPYHRNLGYLGCALKMMAEVGWNTVGKADYCIISNVDLTLREDFLQILATTEWPDDAGWLAPDIYTARLDHHDNPFQTHRPRRRDFLRWRLLYSSPILYRLLEKVYQIRKKRQSVPTEQQSIYAGHGSLMVFTKSFISRHPNLRFPAFMYGEELFLGELISRDALRTYYTPSLHVSNVGRVSTGKYDYRWLCHQNRESLRAIREYDFGH